jgi:hypothetical protein
MVILYVLQAHVQVGAYHETVCKLTNAIEKRAGRWKQLALTCRAWVKMQAVA